MIIVNADDLGRIPAETDAALECFKAGRITSTSAMVFMSDSKRAADLAKDCGIGVGLHLNLSQRFTGTGMSPALEKAHERVVRFMTSSKFAVLFYHPALRRDFRSVFEAQAAEFVRLFGRAPSHIDGHQHRHLCANMLIDGIIPRGQRVRRNFSFFQGDKSIVNRAYRRLIDRRLARDYRLTDYFFSLPQCVASGRMAQVVELARTSKVELMAHPVKRDEFDYLMSDTFGEKLRSLEPATYASV